MERDDLPVISLPTDLSETAEAKKSLGEMRKPAEPARPVLSQAAPPPVLVRPPAPVPPPPAKVSPITVVGAAAAAASGNDDDPERLLREYAERQKTRVMRLEQQIVDLKRVLAERDALRARCESLDRELGETRKQADGAVKAAEEINKELQRKVDDALLSHSLAASENAKLKMRVQEIEGAIKKAEERATTAERNLADTQSALRYQHEARQEAEARIAAALQSLQRPAARPGVPPAAAPPRK